MTLKWKFRDEVFLSITCFFPLGTQVESLYHYLNAFCRYWLFWQFYGSVVFCLFVFGVFIVILLLIWHPLIIGTILWILSLSTESVCSGDCSSWTFFVFSIIVIIVIFVRIRMFMGIFLVVWFPIGVMKTNRLLGIVHFHHGIMLYIHLFVKF